MFRHFLQKILTFLAKRVISRYKPTVVGVTGSVGKTTAKEAIYAVLKRRFSVLRNEDNLNQEIGVPLTILGIKPFYKGGKTLWKRVKFTLSIISKLWLAFGFPKGRFPKFLVLEIAADRPGDIKYLVNFVKPLVGVVTAVGEIPVHVEFYTSPKEVAGEKSFLIKNLPAGGLAVLNYDDQTVLDMKKETKASVISFGFSKEADIWATDISYFTAADSSKIDGLSFKIHHNSSFMPMKLNRTVAPHQIYAVLTAVAVGLRFGFNLVEISESLENIKIPPGRMTLSDGIKNSIVINDTYNASPIAVHAALDTLKKFGDSTFKLTKIKGRKIAILGDMKELGKYEVEAHRTIGNLAAERSDILITVGGAAKFIADSAANQMKTENIFSFSNSAEAAPKVKEIIKEGDVVLVKGSRSMEMEKVVEEIALK